MKRTLNNIIRVLIYFSSCSLHLFAADSTVVIDGCGNFLNITELLREPLISAYGKTCVKEVSFENSQFSPDGRMLAIQVSHVSNNDEIWIFDIASKKAREVIEHGIKDKITIEIKGFKWLSNDTLLIKVNRQDYDHLIYAINGQIANPEDYKYSGNFLVTATLVNSNTSIFKGSDIDKFVDGDWQVYSTSPSKRYRISSPYPADTLSFIDLKSNTKKILSYSYFGQIFQWTRDERFLVFMCDKGSCCGSSLRAAYINHLSNYFSIAEGLLINAFSVSPHGDKVAYSPSDSEVVIFDLLSRKNQAIIKTSYWPTQIVWSSQNQLLLCSNNCENRKKRIEELGEQFPYPLYLLTLSKWLK